MITTYDTAIEEGQIRNLMNDWVKAIRAKDCDTLMSNYAPGVLLFDLITPLQYVGSEAGRQRMEEWFGSFRGPIEFETRNLSITAGDDVAFCHSLNRVSGTMTDGENVDMWWRATVCFRKIGGRWMIAHEHSSVPFDTETGRASLDLKP